MSRSHRKAKTSHSTAGEGGTVGEVFRAFLILGLTSFGGPVAHLGYYREAFVVRRKWLSESAYADLVALCQFLPGPASSQVSMAIGLKHAGYGGMAAAWTAFTLPSALLMVAFAFGLDALEQFGGGQVSGGWVAGFKAAAVAVVAHAVVGMARTLTPDKERAAIAALGLAIAVLVSGALGQVAAIGIGGLIGALGLRADRLNRTHEHENLAAAVSNRMALGALAVFFILLAALPLWAQISGDGGVRLFDSFYRAGALVFGGGHVVLPLLQAEMVGTGLVNAETFLTGYGAAQAVPGPLFTFAAFLGAANMGLPSGVLGAAIALVAIFLPSALLIIGGLRYWDRLRAHPLARRALMGVNAAVVGLLGAALYDPVFTQGVTSPTALVIVVGAFVLLSAWKTPAWAVVALAAVSGGALL